MLYAEVDFRLLVAMPFTLLIKAANKVYAA